MDFLTHLDQHWNTSGVATLSGNDPEVVDALAQRLCVHLPNDFRDFYTFCNGIESTDNGLNAFWPIEEIDSVPTKLSGYTGIPDYSQIVDNLPNAEDYYVFADHSIWVCVYAIRLSNEPNTPTPVIWIGDGRSYDTIANSFAEFWLRYIALPDDKCLWP